MSYGHSFFLLMGKWFRGLESNQLPPAYEADERPVLFPGMEMDPPAGAAPAWSALRVRCIATSATEEWTEMVLPRGLAPRASAFAGRRAKLLHFGNLERLRHVGAAPTPTVWKTAVLAVTPMTLRKMVAASGIAPDSPRLQRGANLSQLRNHGPSARYRPAVSRLSGEGSAFELRRNEEMVARCGNAPQFAGCRPAVLLLNYRA